MQSTLKTGILRREHDQFLERYRYLIIASQLLDEETRPANGNAIPSLSRRNDSDSSQSTGLSGVSLLGTLVTGTASFTVAWTYSWARSLAAQNIRSCLLIFFIALGVATVLFVTLRTIVWRDSSQRLQRNVVDAVSQMITNAHSLDSLSRTAFTMIQEMEIVARGYGIGQVLPPVSRLEDQAVDRRCPLLRNALADGLRLVHSRFIASHCALQPFCDPEDVSRYHEIYDVSPQDMAQVEDGFSASFQDQTSLKGLRYIIRLVFVARQILLCDLLTISPHFGRPGTDTWQPVLRAVQSIAGQLQQTAESLENALAAEDKRAWGEGAVRSEKGGANEGDGGAPNPPSTPGRERAIAQLRRLDNLSHGVRTLHAKTLLLRDEANALLQTAQDNAEVSAALSKQYETIGAEIRGLLAEWENGRHAMLLSVDPFNRFSSRSSSGMRSPMSPVSSIGGVTAVEGSPADALRALTGEIPRKDGPEHSTSDEEVFEAIAMPRKRMSMTREEKMAKMQEDRRKRATLQERTDANTNMLRELETVIKLRPRGHATPRVTSV